jgi:hypothetical protein
MIKSDKELVPIEEKKHTKELHFQDLIKEYPDLIPGDQIDSENPRRWLYVGSEVNFPVIGGRFIRLDLLFLDQDGVPTLVELKRSEDFRAKSEVSTQILEYGANILLSMDTRSIKEMTESNNDKPVSEFLDEDDTEEEYWEKVYDNLKAENIRLLVVADEIPNRLKNIIEFLNRNMNSISILAVEIKQYDKDDVKTLVPRVIGQSIATQTRKSRISGGTTLTYEDLFESVTDEGKAFYEELFYFCEQENFEIILRTKGFPLRIPINGAKIKILEGYSGRAAEGQHIVSRLTDLKTKVNNGNEIVDRYVRAMLKIDGFYAVGDGFKFKIEKNLDEENWNLLKRTITEVVEQIRSNGFVE